MQYMTFAKKIPFSVDHDGYSLSGLVWALQNFGGNNANAVTRGWNSGANSAHGGGVGMFGTWGVENADLAHPDPHAQCSAKCSSTETADGSCCDEVYNENNHIEGWWGTDHATLNTNCKDEEYFKEDWFECDCHFHKHFGTHGDYDTGSEAYWDCWGDKYGHYDY